MPEADELGLADVRRLLGDEDGLTLMEMDRARRAAVVRRARALETWRERGSSLELRDGLSAAMRVSPQRLYQLARAWRKPSLAALGMAPRPHEGRPSTLSAGVRDAVFGELRRMMSEHPGIRRSEAFRRLRRLDLGGRPSDRVLYDWWDMLVRDAPRPVLTGRLHYAYVALDAVLDGSAQHEAAFLVDPGGGLVLGAAVATGRGMGDAYADATRDAVRRLRNVRLRGTPAAGADAFDFDVVPADDGYSWSAFQGLGARRPFAFESGFDESAFEAGRRAIARVMSHRIGLVPISTDVVPWRTDRHAARTLHPYLGDAPEALASIGDHEELPVPPDLSMEDVRLSLERAVDARVARALERYDADRREPVSTAAARRSLVSLLDRAVS